MMVEWTLTSEHAPDGFGTYTVKYIRNDGTFKITAATYYPDGKWYTQDGRPTRQPDMWKPYKKRHPKAKTIRYD